MTNFLLYNHTPGTGLRPGVVFYTTDERNEYLLFKVIAIEDSGEILASCYWPSDRIPELSNWRTFDLRAACEVVPKTVLTQIVTLSEETISNHELEELTTYRRISEGKRNRALQLEVLLEQAAGFANSQAYERAIAVYTECASFARYHFTVFYQRGFCLFHTAHYAEAIADLEHALTIDATHIDAMWWCANAYLKRNLFDKAQKKLVRMMELQPSHTEASKLLKEVSGRR